MVDGLDCPRALQKRFVASGKSWQVAKDGSQRDTVNVVLCYVHSSYEFYGVVAVAMRTFINSDLPGPSLDFLLRSQSHWVSPQTIASSSH